MMTTKKIETPVGRIHVSDSTVDAGKHPVLVLVHGLMVSAASFAPLFDALGKGRRIVAFDFPDHGHSVMGKRFIASWDGYGEALLAVVDELGLKSFDLCGHSMGGGVAARFAATHPGRVEKLVLIDSVTGQFKFPLKGRIPLVPLLGDVVMRRLYGETLFFSYFRNDVFLDAKKMDVARIRSFYQGFDNNRASILRGIRATANPGPVVSMLPNIEAETLIIWGRQDPLIPLYVGNETVRKIKRANLQTIDNCGHSPMDEAADRTAQLMVEFLG